MEIKQINNQATGTWYRDAELISLSDGKHTGLEIVVYKDSDNTKWRIVFRGIIVYKVTSEEFMTPDLLAYLDYAEGFLEVVNSPWIDGYQKEDPRSNLSDDRHHYVYYCYDEAIEVIAKEFTVEEIKEVANDYGCKNVCCVPKGVEEVTGVAKGHESNEL